MLSNQDKLMRIEQEKIKIQKEIDAIEKSIPVSLAIIHSEHKKLKSALDQITSAITKNDKDDLEWLADDIINHGSLLASSIRKLSE